MDSSEALSNADPARHRCTEEIPITSNMTMMDLRLHLTLPSRAEIARREQERSFLTEAIFRGLPEMTISFDVPEVRYFSRRSFREVVSRCDNAGVRILGTEVFTRRGFLVDVWIATGSSNSWCLDLINAYSKRRNLIFSATYIVSS